MLERIKDLKKNIIKTSDSLGKQTEKTAGELKLDAGKVLDFLKFFAR